MAALADVDFVCLFEEDTPTKLINAAKPPEEQPEFKLEFQPGDHVKITGGPFENMEGTVDETLPDQGKVRVIVTIFGRATPVELEYWLISRAED